jgi:hypothetical protein
MKRRRVELAGILAMCAYSWAQAAGPRLAMELESEKDRKTGIRNYAVSAKPGWEFPKSSPINLVELLIEHGQDTSRDEHGVRERETKLFLRLRHAGNVTTHASYYIRGGIGRNFNNDRDFTYANIEPGLKYELSERWEWTLGVRFIDAIDGTDGQRVRKYITGPSFALDKANELELRYARGSGDKDLTSWSLGFLHRF